MNAKSILSVVLIFVAVLIAADLVGVFASFILDVAPLRDKSAGLGYAIWLVIGVFAGVVAFGAAADGAREPKRSPGERRTRCRIILTVAVVLVAALTAAFWVLFWGADTGRRFAVVPDHMPTTMVFFVAFLGACLLGFKIETDDGPVEPQRRRKSTEG